jgi:hypothetical protein
MTISVTAPKPGDLITADYFKQIVDTLSALDQRLASLEELVPGGLGKVAIQRLSPASDVHIGDPLTIIGVNFGLPGQNLVMIGTTQILPDQFISGDDHNIEFQVPDMNLPADGKVTLRLTNPRGDDSFDFKLLPRVQTVVHGHIDMPDPKWPAVAKISAGTSYRLTYTLQAKTNISAEYSLKATVAPDTGSSTGWLATVVDEDDSPMPTLTIAPATVEKPTISVAVVVQVPTGATGGASVRLVVSTAAGDASGDTEKVPFTIDAPPPDQPNLTVSLADPGTGTLSGGALVIPNDQPCPIILTISGAPAGQTISCSISNLAISNNSQQLWKATLDGGTAPFNVPPTLIGMTITGGNDAPAAEVTFKLSSSDQKSFGFMRLSVKRA